jgi:DNA-binding PadR family transcriptional regulator
MYELFVLGKLMHRAMHGYMLQSIINAAVGPFRRLSWGTLYPLLRKLEEAGFIAVQDGKSTDGRGTKNYRTTPLGRKRFFELMRSLPDRDTEHRDLFRVKLSAFGHIGIDEQRRILMEYREYVAAIVTHSEAMSSQVMNAPGLAPAERHHVLKAIDHQRHLAACETAWVDALIKTLGGEHVLSHISSSSGGRSRPGSGAARRQPASEVARPDTGRENDRVAGRSRRKSDAARSGSQQKGR